MKSSRYQLQLLQVLATVLHIILGSSYLPVRALDNGLAKTPPMGWISWERFTCDTNCDAKNNPNCIGYQLYSRIANSMKQKGFVAAGYNYVNIDDCWSELQRDSKTGSLVPDRKRFRGYEGMKQLVRELANLGIKLGIYGDCGTETCAKYPAQLSKFDSDEDNYFDKDAETFYSWGVESFKFDGCNISPEKSEQICPGMSKALRKALNSTNSAPKPILLTCEWPYYMMSNRHTKTPLKVDWDLVKESCNLWRHYEDIYDSWISILSVIDYSVAMQDVILGHHGPGAWFDPDQLVIGGFGLSHDQARAHMGIWSLWSAPLFMSNDIDKLGQKELDLLQNKKLIRVNQDPLGIWAQMVLEPKSQHWSIGKMQVFVKPVKPLREGFDLSKQLYCPDFVIAYFYRGSLGNSVKFSIPVREILLASEQLIKEASKRLINPEFAAKCMERIKGSNPDTNKPIETFLVEDLMDSYPDTHLNLTDNLKLEVNPTGIRVVKLVEVPN